MKKVMSMFAFRLQRALSFVKVLVGKVSIGRGIFTLAPDTPTADELRRRNETAKELRLYLSFAQFFTMHKFRDDWSNSYPGQTGFAKFTLASFVARIVASWVFFGLPAASIGSLIAVISRSNIHAMQNHFMIAAVCIASIISPFRWLPSWLFVPPALLYSYLRDRHLRARDICGAAIPIAMNDYHLLLSYGTVLGILLAVATGQHGGSVYSRTIIGACAMLGTLVAAAILNLIPSYLFSQGRYSICRTTAGAHRQAVHTTYAAIEGTSETSSLPVHTNRFASVAETSLVDDSQSDLPIFRWESAFQTIDGRPTSNNQPRMVRADDGSFQIQIDGPLRPPTE